MFSKLITVVVLALFLTARATPLKRADVGTITHDIESINQEINVLNDKINALPDNGGSLSQALVCSDYLSLEAC